MSETCPKCGAATMMLEARVQRLEEVVRERRDCIVCFGVPPTPSAMLGEALALLERAQALCEAARDAQGVHSPVIRGLCEDMRARVGDVAEDVRATKREADAREGRG